MSDRNRQDRTLQRRREHDDPEDESLSLSDLAPLAEKWIENQKLVADKQLEIAKLQYAAAEKQSADASATQQHRDGKIVEDRKDAREFQKFKLRHLFWYAVGFSGFILAIAAGLIFYLRELQAGLLVLSHFFALISGVAAGLGLTRKRQPEEATKPDGAQG